jgi:hypothetical protein
MPQSKVQTQEYDGDGGDNVIAQGAEPQPETAKGKPSSWEVGQAAPRTVFLDADGKVTADEPERGKILVVEGDVVTKSIADKLGEK